MKKGIKQYVLVWVIMLALFNVVCFATPSEAAGYTKYDATFWTAYVFITLAFVGQLLCAFKAFSAADLQRLFYNMPLITISYTGLIVMLIAGAVSVAIPGFPSRAGIILCFAVLAFTAAAVVKATAAADLVERVDEKVKTRTSFIKDMTLKAESLMSRAKDAETKALCKKVYETLRYSDPVSNSELSVIEAKITVAMDELSSAVGTERAKDLAEEILILAEDRNNRAKLLK